MAVDTLDCLRTVPFASLNAALNTTAYSVWFPIVDGDIVRKFPSIQLAAGDFVKGEDTNIILLPITLIS